MKKLVMFVCALAIAVSAAASPGKIKARYTCTVEKYDAATKTLNINVPVVVRLAGTAEEEGRAILAGTKFTPATSMQEAAQKVVELAGLREKVSQ